MKFHMPGRDCMSRHRSGWLAGGLQADPQSLGDIEIRDCE